MRVGKYIVVVGGDRFVEDETEKECLEEEGGGWRGGRGGGREGEETEGGKGERGEGEGGV